jgi:tetratricopeptide (TPR) repeat protein
MAAVSLIALTAPTAGLAQAPAAVAAAPTANQNATAATVAVDTVITVHPDMSVETIETHRTKILGPGAIQSESQQPVAYIEGMQTLDIEAYTEKPDGSKIPVEPASILTHDAGNGLAAIYTRDTKISTVIFSNVAVGDTLVLKFRRVEKSGMFAGNYVQMLAFPLNLPLLDSNVTIIAPNDITLNVGTYGEALDHQVTSDETTTRHTIAYHPQHRVMPEPGATSILDRDPRVIISSFDTYEQLGRSYWDVVQTKATPTEEITKLADKITTGIDDKREQAAAIDHWIKRNIRYVGVYLGTGRWIANDPSSVLKNQYGDCKDHATLMAALLAAKGIATEQVLINLGDVYSLPDTVAPGYFNHMIVYLPELGMYDDPTASQASFGVLARQAYDKPVLHISAQGSHLGRTPPMQAAENTTTNHTRIAIAADGTVTGESEDTGTGANASELRGVAMKFQAIGLETAAERMLKYYGIPGKGRYEIGTPDDGAAQYTIGGKFTLTAHVKVEPGAVLGIPRGMDVLAPGRPGEVLFGVRSPSRQFPFVCSAGRQIEDIEVSFADGLPLPAAPKGIKIDQPLFSYVSQYQIENRTLKIRREFESHVPGQVCAPETEAQIADPLKSVQADLGVAMFIPKAEPPKVAKMELPKASPADELRHQCAGLDNTPADKRISACTAVIQADQETQASLATLFLNRGNAYRMKADNTRAVADFDQAIKLVPSYVVAFNARGLARQSLRNYDGAISDFSQAIVLNPMFAGALANRGSAYWAKGDRSAAMADFNQATTVDPMSTYALEIRGRAYRLAGDFDRAIADFDQMIRLQHNNAGAWNERCYTHLVANAAPAAVEDCTESLRLDPKMTAALSNRGLALLRSDQIDRAIADYDAALKLTPKFASALYGRGLAKLKKGDAASGNADIVAALALKADIATDFAKLGLTVATQDATPAKSVL